MCVGAALLALGCSLLLIVSVSRAFGAVPGVEPSSASLVFNVHGHTGPVRRIAASLDGKLAITVSDDKTALVWDVAANQLLRTLRVPVGDDVQGRLYGVAIAPDSRLVALAGTSTRAGGIARIYLFDLQNGAFGAAFDARGDDIRQLAWSPDGSLIAAVYVGRAALRVFHPDGTLAYEQSLPADSYGVSFSRDGQLAVAAFDGTVRLFRTNAGTVIPDGEIAVGLKDPVSVCHSPDGRILAVGYFSRAGRNLADVDVYDGETHALVRRLEFHDIQFGNLRTVGWSADGRALYAAGSAYNVPGRFIVERIAWPSGNVDSALIDGDSILDFAALPGGRIAFADFDATWGILDGLKVVARSESPVLRVVAASALQISADASKIQWRDAESKTHSFAMASRHVGNGEADARLAPLSSSAQLRVTGWEDTRNPAVDGRPVGLTPDELSRAAALLPDASAVVLAGSRALRSVGKDGATRWAVPLATEARAIDVSADGRVVVVALADGTLNWRRTSDGVLLLSLMLLRDGRWVVWTADGYFDAGPGAEDLVGWLVPRPGGEQADYFGVSRFRDRNLRPDVIDGVLAHLGADAALEEANQARLQSAREEADLEVIRAVQKAQDALPPAQALPPVVTLAQMPKIETSGVEVGIDVNLFAAGGQPVEKLEARIDGRPVAAVAMPIAAHPTSDRRMLVQLPKAEGRIQIFAENANGTSMPVDVSFHSSAPGLQPIADRRPRMFLLAVGVSRYANPDYNLELAAKDAGDFARAFERQEGLFYRRVESRVLVDEQATTAAVLQGLRWLQNSTTADDVAVLFLAGHGVADAADLYHFLPHDVRESNLSQTSVSEAQLRGTLSAIKGRALFFVDTCFAGKSVGRFSHREITRMANGLASADMGVIVFAASAPRQESFEDSSWGNGAFTKALVEGLSGGADFRREGLVTHKGLDYYTSHAVSTLTQGRQTPVTAVPNGISDFALASVQAGNNAKIEEKP